MCYFNTPEYKNLFSQALDHEAISLYVRYS